MDDFIFSPKQKTDSTDTNYYCMTGSENYTDGDGFPRSEKDGKNVLAKRVSKTDSQPQYFIKISNSNKLFNPLGSGLDEKSYSIVDNVCRPSDKFRSVNEKVFNLYLNFLSTKNISWLTRAEREII
jgi:hypothetical protein